MKIVEVIESKHWVNTKTGQTASIYGSVPYTSELDKPNWIIVVRGYTWRLDNGTIGLGRQPVKTVKEAKEIMSKFNKGSEG